MADQTRHLACGKGQRKRMQQRASGNAKGDAIECKSGIGLRVVFLHVSQLK